jgi:hypothetical protein
MKLNSRAKALNPDFGDRKERLTMHDSPEPLKNLPEGQAPDYMLGR